MTVARFKDLCIDVTAVDPMAAFWSQALGLTIPAENPAVLVGDVPEKTVWLNQVPEPRTVKQRVHLDVHTGPIEELERLGAAMLVPPDDDRRWALMADPEGGEVCAFPRDTVPEYRLMEVVVDAADPIAQGHWWANLIGGDVQEEPVEPAAFLRNVPGLPFPEWVFQYVPEPKTVKNRIHWDVTADSLQAVLDQGATLLREQDQEIGWHVCADPEGNEFCVFLPSERVEEAS